MIRVQLWRQGRQITEKACPDSHKAEAVIDQILTSVHAGKFGEGIFSLEADLVEAPGLYLGSFYRIGRFEHPAPPWRGP